jgi:hypothetical protein
VSDIIRGLAHISHTQATETAQRQGVDDLRAPFGRENRLLGVLGLYQWLGCGKDGLLY